MPTRRWGTEKLVNTTLTGNQLSSKIATLTDGSFVVVWQDESTIDTAILAQRYDAAGNRLGGELIIASSVGIDFVNPDIAALADGTFYVTATQIAGPQNYIVGSIWGANGTVVRSQQVELGALFNDNSDIARLGNGSVVAWVEPIRFQQNHINFRIFDAAGNPGGVVFANYGVITDSTAPSIATAPSGVVFAVVWEEATNQRVLCRFFNQFGTALTDQFIVNNVVGARNFSPTVTWLNNSDAAVSWVSSDGGTAKSEIYVKLLRVIGGITVLEVTDKILVNSTTFDYQFQPEITVLPDGGFVVCWSDSSGFGGDAFASIKLQAFAGSGSKIGGEILVNSTTTHLQELPSVAALADGRVAVSWTDYSSGNADVRMQIIDPRDGIVNGSNTADLLYGHDSVGDDISGFDGADTMYGLAGADTINGGAGADNIFGGRGDDTSFGGNDGDRIYGDLGDDEQYGEGGSDLIYSGAGSDLMDGGTGVGSDTAYYSSEKIGAIINLADQSQNAGSALGDTLLNFELIFGSNTGADTITGSGASETILGNGGADILNGSGGNDTLRGGVGVDTLNGGTGADKFQYTALNEVGDVITNYEAVDDFQFTRAAFGNLAGANVAAVNFLSVASGHAAVTASQFFIFDQALDQLWYDADGSSATIAAVMVADLSNNINVTNLDLLLI